MAEPLQCPALGWTVLKSSCNWDTEGLGQGGSGTRRLWDKEGHHGRHVAKEMPGSVSLDTKS